MSSIRRRNILCCVVTIRPAGSRSINLECGRLLPLSLRSGFQNSPKRQQATALQMKLMEGVCRITTSVKVIPRTAGQVRATATSYLMVTRVASLIVRRCRRKEKTQIAARPNHSRPNPNGLPSPVRLGAYSSTARTSSSDIISNSSSPTVISVPA